MPVTPTISKASQGSNLQATVAHIDLSGSRIDAAQSNSLAVGKVVHGVQCDVEAGSGVVDGKNVDGLAVVAELPAGTALQVMSDCVPTRDVDRYIPGQSSSLTRRRRHRCKGTWGRRPEFASRSG